jgi:hypothetical protein
LGGWYIWCSRMKLFTGIALAWHSRLFGCKTRLEHFLNFRRTIPGKDQRKTTSRPRAALGFLGNGPSNSPQLDWLHRCVSCIQWHGILRLKFTASFSDSFPCAPGMVTSIIDAASRECYHHVESLTCTTMYIIIIIIVMFEGHVVSLIT